jgi:sec-independent protein translocase protein TatA
MLNNQHIILFLNDIGTSEVIFIMVVVLMLFGAKGIPSVAKNLGRGMREIKTASDEIKRDIQQSAAEMKRDLNMPNMESPMKNINKTVDVIKNPIKEIGKSIIDTSKETNESPTTKSE